MCVSEREGDGKKRSKGRRVGGQRGREEERDRKESGCGDSLSTRK